MVDTPDRPGASANEQNPMATQRIERPDFAPLPVGATTAPVLPQAGEQDTNRLLGLVRFPSGQQLLPKLPFREEVFETVAELIDAGQCQDGRFEIETPERRLSCLIHRGQLYQAGLLEGENYSSIPLSEFPLRAREMRPAKCRLVKSDPTEVLITAVHFAKRPALRGSVRFVDPARVLEELAHEKQDAAMSFLSSNQRTLLFLHRGKPTRLFFANPKDDPGGGSLEERMLLFAFGPTSGKGVVEVFTDLRLTPDPDAGVPLRQLVAAANPAPPATVYIHMDGHEVRQRPFTGPSMVIGRDPKVDVFIDNLGVSRRHAMLKWEQGAFFIEDLGSSNGTFIGKDRITSHRLAPNETARLGKFDLTLVRKEHEEQVDETMFVSRANMFKTLPPPVIKGDGVELPLRRELLVGKGQGVDLVARGWGVGAVHARVTSTETYGRAKIVCFDKRRVKVGNELFGTVEVGLDQPFKFGRTTFTLTAAKLSA